MNCDLVYFERRASEERAAALRASDPRAKRVHHLMAESYEAKVQALASRADAGPPVFH